MGFDFQKRSSKAQRAQRKVGWEHTLCDLCAFVGDKNYQAFDFGSTGEIIATDTWTYPCVRGNYLCGAAGFNIFFCNPGYYRKFKVCDFGNSNLFTGYTTCFTIKN